MTQKPPKILKAIHQAEPEVYVSRIREEVDTTYSHTVKVVNELEELGMVESEKKGRKKILSLSDYGEDVAEKITELLDAVKKRN